MRNAIVAATLLLVLIFATAQKIQISRAEDSLKDPIPSTSTFIFTSTYDFHPSNNSFLQLSPKDGSVTATRLIPQSLAISFTDAAFDNMNRTGFFQAGSDIWVHELDPPMKFVKRIPIGALAITNLLYDEIRKQLIAVILTEPLNVIVELDQVDGNIKHTLARFAADGLYLGANTYDSETQTYFFINPIDNVNYLQTVNLKTGEQRNISNVGSNVFDQLQYNPKTKSLNGLTNTTLFDINLTNGDVTPILKLPGPYIPNLFGGSIDKQHNQFYTASVMNSEYYLTRICMNEKKIIWNVKTHPTDLKFVNVVPAVQQP